MTDSPIQQASQSLRNGQFDQASTLLEAALTATPRDAAALRMLGTVRYLTKRFDEAAELLQRSLAEEPDNSKTLLNAGTVWLALGNFAQAEAVFVRLIELEPNDADAHFNLGVTHQRNGKPGPAAEQYTQALTLDSEHVDAEINLAAVCLTLRDYATSVIFCDRVLKRDPKNTQAQLWRGRAHAQLGNMDEAGRQLKALLSTSPSDPMFATEWGIYLVMLGRYDEALIALEMVLKSDPGQTKAASSVVSVLLELGRFDEAAAKTASLTAQYPDVAELWGQHGSALAQVSGAAEAAEAFERAIALSPDSVPCLLGSAQNLMAQGKFEDAESFLDRAVQLAPQLAPAVVLKTQVKTRQGLYEQALQGCDNYLQEQPLERSVLAAKTLVLSALGREDECRRLVDLDRLVCEMEPQVPVGYASLADFNRALAEHVRCHPSLADSPRSHATSGGLHSGPLRVEPKGPVTALERTLYACARAYMESLESQADHPFLANRPDLGMLYCWGVVMKRQGHQSPHIHPSAWVSGVYYPKVPDIVETSSSFEGWLEFGAAPDNFELTMPTPTRRIKPFEGLLLLFPSYFYHRTIPFDADQERVSIAFDLFPKTDTSSDPTQWLTNSLVAFA